MIVDSVRIPDRPGETIGFDSTGAIYVNDALVSHVELPLEPDHEPWCDKMLRPRIHIAHDGSYAAIANDYGRFGVVFEVATGRVTMQLDGGSNDNETVPFSIAFVSHQGKLRLIHRSDWNRLDISDPATGECLTNRVTSHKQGEAEPSHYLDYFHGRLHVSPDGRWILDDGWIWHPIGVPVIWNVEAWFRNIWESDDGPTRRELCGRDYHWDCPMRWIDNTTVAISGLGEGFGVDVRPGVRFFRVEPVFEELPESFEPDCIDWQLT